MKLNGWQRAWIVVTLVWLAYWGWITRGMSFDTGDVPFIARVILAPPLLLYVAGWVIARIVRFTRAGRDD
jgi:hypothetical protein